MSPRYASRRPFTSVMRVSLGARGGIPERIEGPPHDRTRGGGPLSAGVAPEDAHRVLAAEAEAVDDRHVDRGPTRRVRHIVQVAGRIRCLLVDRRWNDPVPDREH